MTESHKEQMVLQKEDKQTGIRSGGSSIIWKLLLTLKLHKHDPAKMDK